MLAIENCVLWELWRLYCIHQFQSSTSKASISQVLLRKFAGLDYLNSCTYNVGYNDVFADAGVQLPPSRRRSLFTLSTAFLVFAGRAYGVPQLGTVVKASLTNTTVRLSRFP